MRMPWPGLPAREQESEALHVLPLCPELAAAERPGWVGIPFILRAGISRVA